MTVYLPNKMMKSTFQHRAMGLEHQRYRNPQKREQSQGDAVSYSSSSQRLRTDQYLYPLSYKTRFQVPRSPSQLHNIPETIKKKWP